MALLRRTRVHIWFRLLLLQGSWNFERLQGLGFFFALLPGLKKLYPKEKLAEVGRHYLGYFNTHPYLAPLVAGAVLKLEEDRAKGQQPPVEIEEFKEMVAAPYAAIGDALFWGGLRPLAAGIALFFAAKGILWAPLVFLFLYNLIPMLFRISGFIRGYQQGIASVEFFQKRRLPDWAIHTKEAAVVVLGGLSAFLVFQHLQRIDMVSWVGLLAIVPVIVLGLLARKGVSTLLLVLLSAATIILLSLFWTDVTSLVAMI
ncbi:PTS system IID component, Man family [Malonomonas rubra DSM 5091]|uniref:PTS system IID component, Man family n=1 Tax=Malonomonas rubra DSM 5091 TaxID=1122189 RepID=A0A1M6DXM1_MALRU|nr:PTS system mannose/fructose/sorbose family transporter subunit IID [Malonomonas rubra]SHI77870.1 PTS system IID component, Man family [Malonomonas rubra DSM 5091]